MKTTEERFWEKVDKTPGDGCWEWTGALLKSGGYGAINIGGVVVRTHRWAWENHNGRIPDGLFVCHKCDNPKCVRPDHLFLGTAEDNNQDMTYKERHGRMLFTHDKVRRLRLLYERHKDHLSHRRIAEWFGVSKAAISHMLGGRNWRGAAHPATNTRKRRYNSKLDADKVRQIRARRLAGEKIKILSKEFGINESGISKICRGEKWSHV